MWTNCCLDSEALNGDEGNDRLCGGAGNDSLNGGKGHDTCVFEAGDGADTILEPGIYGDNDDLVFGSGIDWKELWLQQQGNSLVVSVLGTTDKVAIQDWFINPGRVVETMRSGDGKVLHSSEITTLVAAMAAFQPGTTSSSTVVSDPEDYPARSRLADRNDSLYPEAGLGGVLILTTAG
jgi:hypothetical protein